MNDIRLNPASLLALLLRRVPLILSCAAIGAAAGVVLSGFGSSQPPEYESRSLVVASSWELRIEGLPRMVETIVETTGFRQEIRRADDTAFARSADFDRFIQIVPVQDTVAVWLRARGESPEMAQRRAEVASGVLAAELNQLGTDIGVFVVQDEANLPHSPLREGFSLPVMFILGGFGGLLLGTGLAVAWPVAGGWAGSEASLPPVPRGQISSSARIQPLPDPGDIDLGTWGRGKVSNDKKDKSVRQRSTYPPPRHQSI